MRLNEDGKTVRAMDILFPGIGEIVGGSQREERYDVLKQKVADFGIEEESLWWYLETRKFGTCVHSGFGLGFEYFATAVKAGGADVVTQMHLACGGLQGQTWHIECVV